MSTLNKSFLGAIAVAVIALAGCAERSKAAPQRSLSSAQLANPASLNCIDKGGTHAVERTPTGGEYGVCIFSGNRQCEEWALLRGECPSGGIQMTEYVTQAARYCAITGGTYAPVKGGVDEQGSCALPKGPTCDADAYFHGTCGRAAPIVK
jgi:putative hemolysin